MNVYVDVCSDKRFNGSHTIRSIVSKKIVNDEDSINEIAGKVKEYLEKSRVSYFLSVFTNNDNNNVDTDYRIINPLVEGGSKMSVPKFELICKSDGEPIQKVFILKNVSSVIVSNIIVEDFVLISVDGSRQSLFMEESLYPTSLGSNESFEFRLSHRVFERRGVGYKEFQLIFTAEDDQSNKYRCEFKKNVEDGKNYMLGLWNTQVYQSDQGLQNTKDNVSKPTVFISYNWGSDKMADEVEKRLKPIAEVLRDKSSIRPWGSIKEFMNKIRDTDLVVVIISDAYLKSTACLYEIMQLLKNKKWISQAMFLVEDSAKGIYKPAKQLEYVRFWNTERDSLKNELEGMDPSLVIYQAEELNKISLIQLNINEFMKSVADRNNPDIVQALDAIERRVKNNCLDVNS